VGSTLINAGLVASASPAEIPKQSDEFLGTWCWYLKSHKTPRKARILKLSGGIAALNRRLIAFMPPA
jgi:hypothetical protein